MQEHEKTFLTLLVLGALIGLSRLLVSDEQLSWRLIIGRTILGSAASTIAGLALIQFPDLHPNALIAIASALGLLGSNFIEQYLKKNANRWMGK